MKILTLILWALLITACKRGIREPYSTGLENKPILNINILLPDSATYINTSSFTKGKRTVIFYYNPTCPYCRAQMREMTNHIDKYQNIRLCIITGADFKSMMEFNSYFKLDRYQNIITGIDTGHVLLFKYKAYSVPFTAIFDTNNRLVSAYMGRITGKTLLRATLQ